MKYKVPVINICCCRATVAAVLQSLGTFLANKVPRNLHLHRQRNISRQSRLLARFKEVWELRLGIVGVLHGELTRPELSQEAQVSSCINRVGTIEEMFAI